MTQYLPPNLLALFAPREPIPYLPPAQKLPHEKKTRGYAGVGQFLSNFEDPKDTPLPTRFETRDERYERKRRERAEKAAYKLEQGIALWDPQSMSSATSDPYKSLFIARINYDSTESKLRREFEAYGPIKKIQLVTDKVSGKPRGYAFIEFEHEREMHSAYKHADGKKIDGKRVLVDVERGRTVKGWLPRRLGGGLGGTRKGAPDENVRHSGRDDDRSVERDRYDRDSTRKHESRDRDRSEKRRSRSRERGGEKEREKRRRSKSPKDRERDRDRSDRDKNDRDKSDREKGDNRDKRSRYDNHRPRSERSRNNRENNNYSEEQAGGDAVPERRSADTRDKDFEKTRKRRKSRSHSPRDRKRSHRSDKMDTIKAELKDGSDNGLYDNSDGYENEPFQSGFGDHSNSSSYDQFAAQNYSQPTYVAYNTKEELYSP